MRIFPGWRAVGRVMRWARQQDGVTHNRTVMLDSLDETTIDHLWSRDNGFSVWITWSPSRELIDIRAGGAVSECSLSDWDNAAQALRVLAALNLIPAHLAAAEDERYGRCVKCDRTVRWWHEPPFTARWVHVQPWAVTGPAAHLAEVAP